MTEGKWPIIYFVVCLLMFLMVLVTVVENYVVIINNICLLNDFNMSEKNVTKKEFWKFHLGNVKDFSTLCMLALQN